MVLILAYFPFTGVSILHCKYHYRDRVGTDRYSLTCNLLIGQMSFGTL